MTDEQDAMFLKLSNGKFSNWDWVGLPGGNVRMFSLVGEVKCREVTPDGKIVEKKLID